MVDHRRRARGNGRFVKSLDTAQRRARLAQMRAGGATFTEIAKELGYSDRHNARRAFMELMQETVSAPAEEARKRELAKLDVAEQAVWDVLERNHVTVSHGKIIYVGDAPLLDDGPILQAAGELRQILALRAKYEGTFAPTQAELHVSGLTGGDESFAETVRTAQQRRAAARAQMEQQSDDPAPAPAESAGTEPAGD